MGLPRYTIYNHIGLLIYVFSLYSTSGDLKIPPLEGSRSLRFFGFLFSQVFVRFPCIAPLDLRVFSFVHQRDHLVLTKSGAEFFHALVDPRFSISVSSDPICGSRVREGKLRQHC